MDQAQNTSLKGPGSREMGKTAVFTQGDLENRSDCLYD